MRVEAPHFLHRANIGKHPENSAFQVAVLAIGNRIDHRATPAHSSHLRSQLRIAHVVPARQPRGNNRENTGAVNPLEGRGFPGDIRHQGARQIHPAHLKVVVPAPGPRVEIQPVGPAGARIYFHVHGEEAPQANLPHDPFGPVGEEIIRIREDNPSIADKRRLMQSQ